MKIEEQKLLNSQMANWVKELTRWPHRKTGTYEGRKPAEYVEKEYEKTVFMGAWRRCFILLVFWSNTRRDGAGICDRYNSIFYNDALLCGRRNAWRNVKLKSSFLTGGFVL